MAVAVAPVVSLTESDHQEIVDGLIKVIDTFVTLDEDAKRVSEPQISPRGLPPLSPMGCAFLVDQERAEAGINQLRGGLGNSVYLMSKIRDATVERSQEFDARDCGLLPQWICDYLENIYRWVDNTAKGIGEVTNPGWFVKNVEMWMNQVKATVGAEVWKVKGWIEKEVGEVWGWIQDAGQQIYTWLEQAYKWIEEDIIPTLTDILTKLGELSIQALQEIVEALGTLAWIVQNLWWLVPVIIASGIGLFIGIQLLLSKIGRL